MDDSNISAAGDAAETTDPEISKLLDFEPVPRKHKRHDGWTAPLQRIFIARLAELGSVNAATEALGKNRYGVEKLYKTAGADSFRAAWDGAIALFEKRAAERIAAENAPFAGVKPPFVDRRRKEDPPPSPSLEREGSDVREALPVICDTCRAEGSAGDGAFSEIRDIFDFDPVPRPGHDRLWPAETQRAFIAALAVSGSVERAARSVTRHAFGAEKLRKGRGARSFNEAWDAALGLARERELTRLHGTLDDLASTPPLDGEDAAFRSSGGGAAALHGRGDGQERGYGEEDIEEVRERILNKLQRMRERMLREEIIPFPEKRAAWVTLNGAEELEAVENGTWKAPEVPREHGE